jgi:hypothetical protein
MSHSTSRSTRDSKIASWIGDAIRHRGFVGAVRYYAAATVNFLRDLSPQRRRSRYGDIDYDFENGVDTSWATVSLRTRIHELASGAQYQASEPELFSKILRSLPVQPDGFTFIDLGSGKGRTLLMASDYPFHRIVGVELLTDLNEIALRNITAYFSAQQRCFNIKSVAQDARDFQFPDEPVVLYLFNPFPKYVLQAVLNNLHVSLEAHPREIYVLYHNLVQEEIFRAQSWLKEIHRTPQFAIYQAA